MSEKVGVRRGILLETPIHVGQIPGRKGYREERG